MKIKLRLQHKLQLIIITVSVIVFAGSIGYIAFQERNYAYNNQIRLIEAQTEKYAYQIQLMINEDFAVVRTLAQAFKIFDEYPKDEWQSLINKMYGKVFEGNPTFYQLWDSWELKHIDSTWNKPTGRTVNTWLRDQGSIKNHIELRSLNGDSKYYAKDKALARELISELYADAYTTGKTEQKLMTTYESPIIVNKKFIGLVGVDVTLKRFQEVVNRIKIKNLNGSYAFLLSHNGKYAGHPIDENLNQLALKNPTGQEGFDLYKKIQTGKPFSIIHTAEKEEQYVSYFPIKTGRTETYWYLGISVPHQAVLENVNENLYISFISGIIGLFVLGIIIYIVARSITRPINLVTKQLQNLSKGVIDDDMMLDLKTGDEIEDMAKALNRSIEKLKNKNLFAKHLGKGDLDYEFVLKDKEDELAISLIEMRDSLKKARIEEEKRKKEDEIQNWITKGITKTSDILRTQNQSIEKLTYETLNFIIGYLGIEQGAIYIKNDDEEEDIYYDLVSAIAYGRDKLIENRVKHEEGFVGRCAYEGLTIFITELPDDYVNIKSGLGGSNPNNMLLVPVISNDEVLGVIELISFKEIKDYEIKFVEQVGENLAATIGNVRINQKTEKLLRNSQHQADELARQEQEMRQNIEEMKATQEESHVREQEMHALHDAVNDIAYLAEFDMDGNVIELNKNLEILLGKPREQIIGMKQGMFSGEFNQDEFNKLWLKLKTGQTVRKETEILAGSRKVHLLETYKPIYGAEEEPYKVINIAIDISHTEKAKT